MPKNIILLSDGTGNSASGQCKTNVWRLYQAIDINPPRTTNEPEQVVYYDDGVGTGGIRPLAYLGLGFGIGLAQNIQDLYAFLCRNYEPGDNIFLFGFSRGAFTVRMLAGMILRCGIVDPDNDVELNEQVEIAYSAFRRDGALRASKSSAAATRASRTGNICRWATRSNSGLRTSPSSACGTRRTPMVFRSTK
jgi:uncharacterized protein (DUF2235 family)